MTDTKLGIQLYSVRNLLTDNLFKSILESLADMGFQGVEFAWKYGGMEPQELADFLTEANLLCCGLHVSLSELLDPNHKVYQYALACNSPYITTSLTNEVESNWKSIFAQCNEAGKIARDKGLQFTYHNHWHEFVKIDNQLALDMFIEQTDQELVKLELDIGWVKKGGVDPWDYWHKHAQRIKQVHLRDYSVEQQSVVDMETGFISMPKAMELAAASHLEWLIYEQDVYPVSPLESAKVCANAFSRQK